MVETRVVHVFMKCDDWKLLHQDHEQAAALSKLQSRLKIDCGSVDLVFSPIFPPSEGGHFASTFWMPALFILQRYSYGLVESEQC